MKTGLIAMCGVAFAASSPAAAADPSFESVIASISDAYGQAYLWLNKGTYRAEKSGTRMSLHIPADMRSDLKFAVLNRTVQSGDLNFAQPVYLTLQRGSVCVRLRIKRLRYGPGGVFDGASSDTTMSAPPGQASCNDSEALLHLDDVFSLNSDMTQFFRGGFYSALAGTVRCDNSACTATSRIHPIRRAQFYSTAEPGFSVAFQEGSSIILPHQGFIRLAAGSQAKMNSLTYDFTDQSGTADIRSLQLGAQEGVLAGGSTLLKLAPGAELRIGQMQVTQGPAARFELKNGTVGGRLGDGTTISFGSVQGKPSSLLLINADVSLSGLNLVSQAGSTTLSATRGQFQTRVKNADLWLAPDTNLRLGYTNLNFFLGCPDGSPTACAPIEWGSQRTVVRGTIAEFATQITGGQYPFSNAGATRIGQGTIESGTLTLDSLKPISPVTGKITKLELKFSGEDIIIDPQTRIGAALVSLNSANLELVDGQALPVGTLDVAGDVTRVVGGALGGVATGDGKLALRITRRSADDPEIEDGSLTARSHVRLEGNNYADGTLNVNQIKYYKGHGSAKLRLSIDKAGYTITTPSDRKTEDSTFAKAEVNVRSAELRVGLAQPFVVGPVDLYSSGSFWKFTPATAIPLRLYVDIPKHELVYAPIKQKQTGGTLCAPKVELSGQRLLISGKVDLWRSSEGGRVRAYDAEPSGPVDASVNDRGCSEVGALICGAIGSIAGPIGTIGLAMICNAQIETEEAKLSNQIRDQSVELVRDFHYDFDF